MKADPPADRAVVDRWWSEFVAAGRLPAELEPVQTRLVRAVHRGTLPSGPVFVKAMTFPRPKDRVRYLLRPLPGQHEAAMLRATAAAGIACPEVLDVRSCRRGGVPHRSLLVLRALPVVTVAEDDSDRLADEAEVAARLLAAGIVHRDLHTANFVRLADGRLAVLDLQSARLRRATDADRIATAARLLQGRPPARGEEDAAMLQGAGLLRDPGEVRQARAAAVATHRTWVLGRIRRCLQESTEFARTIGLAGVEHRRRGALPAGRWVRGGHELRRAWLGQRALEVLEGRPPLFPAFRATWWWLGRRAALYVPAACSDERIEGEVRAAAHGDVVRRMFADRTEPSRPANRG